MKNILKSMGLILILLLTFSCSSDDDADITRIPTGDSETYVLNSVSNPNISGTATFSKNIDNSTSIFLKLEGAPEDGLYPAHIHFNTAVEGGDIALSLGNIDGSNGLGFLQTSTLDDGTNISYEELIAFDGYINVHLSSEDLGTIVAQGDIGQNELIGSAKAYDLGEVAVEDISGTATFQERANGEVLGTIMLQNTPDGGMHPAHIHANTALEGGDIVFTFNPVNGTTGISKTNIETISYSEILDFDGYINVHLSADDLGTLVAQGDIGENELTGESKVYALGSVAVEDISGTATFEERANGEALATISLDNTPDGGMHPAHIHANTALEGGDIEFTFNAVNGTTGISKTDVETISYSDILDYDGYINVHLSADDLGTLVAQGDIGENELTGESKVYALGSVAVEDISGTATFEERANGESLATISLDNTPDGGMHPAHIHANTALEGGDIEFTFNAVNGTTGISKTDVETISYSEILDYDGYINVHLSADDLGTLVAQGDIGQNELTGTSKSYPLASVAVTTISGTALFEERANGEALATLSLIGTPDGGMHPAHIHAGSVANAPGAIVFTFNSVDGTTGMSKTNIEALNDDSAFGYNDVLAVDGYINVHLSADDLATIVAQGNIGENE